MKQLFYLPLIAGLLLCSFTMNPMESEDGLSGSIDVYYNQDINGYLITFSEYDDFKAFLFDKDGGWSYKLFHNKELVSNREFEPTSNPPRRYESAKAALNDIREEVKDYNKLYNVLHTRKR